MAIKVKHDMNAAPAAAAGVASGRARRSMETARLFASGGGSGGRGGTQGATAHPVAPMGAHAQLTHASAPAVSAHAPAYRDTIDDRMRLLDEQNWAAARRQEAGEDAAQKRAQMGIDADAAKLKSQQDFSTAERIAKAEAAQKEWDRQRGILRQERDADLIAAGTHEYGYSPEVQREYDRLQREYDEGLQSGRFLAGSDDERAFMDEMERQIAALPKTVVPRTDPEGMFNRNTFTDAQGRIFTTDGKLVYNPADAETRRMEFQQRQMDAEEKRYIDAVMKLQQGYRASEPVYKMDELGEKPLTDENGNPIVEKWNSSYRPYTEEQQDAILRRLFPNRFANVQPEPAAQQPPPFQQALQNWLKDQLGTGARQGAQPAAPQPAQPAPTAQQPTAQPTSQAKPVIRQDSQGVSWEVVFDENGKPIGKRPVRQ